MKRASEHKPQDQLIGILGGMGPEATLDLFRHIINLTPAAKDQDHIRVLIYSNPKIPDRTEAFTAGGESPLPCLIEAARLLEEGGAGIIAMPCNAAHHYLPEMRRNVGIPILDMIAETCRTVRSLLPEALALGLLATTGTVRSGIYSTALSREGLKLLLPEDKDHRKVQEAIAQVKAGTHNKRTRENLRSVGMRLMKAGAQAIILGCTEIPLSLDPDTLDFPALNPGKILAQAAVDWALGKRDESAPTRRRWQKQ